jgi:hypothetical protein
VTFRRRVFFDRTTFTGYVSFLHATFESDVFFTGARFLGRSQFTAAKFRRQVSFAETIFSEEATFGRAKFSGPAYFLKTQFPKGITFRLGILENIVVIDEASVGVDSHSAGGGRKPPVLDLSEVRIRGDGGFHVVNVNNAVQPLRLKVLNSVLAGCRFEDVNWLRRGGRLVLHEETELSEPTPPEQPPRHELVKISYDRLTDLFDDTRSYELAEECFIGAMEMARQNPRTPRWHRWSLWAYWAFSAYGTGYGRALLWLLLTVVLFAGLFALPAAGLAPSDTLPGPIRPPRQRLDIAELATAGFIHSAQVSTFARERTYRPSRRLGIVLTTVQPVPVAVFTALFLLAVRRRFHRGH